MSLQVRDVAAPRGTAGSHGRGFYCERAEHRKPLSAQKERSLVWTVTKQITPSLKAAEAKSPEAEKTVGRLKECLSVKSSRVSLCWESRERSVGVGQDAGGLQWVRWRAELEV